MSAHCTRRRLSGPQALLPEQQVEVLADVLAAAAAFLAHAASLTAAVGSGRSGISPRRRASS